MNYLYPFLLLVFLSSCTSKPDSKEEELYSYLNGTFTSENQSQLDSSYYDITIHMAHIWKQREHRWIYAEQALSNAMHNPYTQKVYRITTGEGGKIEMEPFDLKNPEEFYAGWENPSIFNSLTPKDLIPLPGCTLYFRKAKDRYIGETRGRECPSLTTGSSYSTSQIIISKDKLWSWGRGYNEKNEQVWGKTEGGYILDKV